VHPCCPVARAAAIQFTLTAIFSVTFAVAGDSYDARYAYPAFGPLAAGAALGAWGIVTSLLRIRLGRSGINGGYSDAV
jgi:hypothetical protein